MLTQRNDEGETPKDLASRFYKLHVVEFVDNLDLEQDRHRFDDDDDESEFVRRTSDRECF